MSDTSTTDINDLMSQDPLTLKRDDVRAIVAKFREQRTQFNLGVAQAGSTKPKAAPKSKIPGDMMKRLDLGDLGDI